MKVSHRNQVKEDNSTEKQELEPHAKTTVVQLVRTQCRIMRESCENGAAHKLDARLEGKEAQRFCAIFLTRAHTYTCGRNERTFCLKQAEHEAPRHSQMCAGVVAQPLNNEGGKKIIKIKVKDLS